MSRPPPRGFVPQPYTYHEEIEVRVDTLTNLGVGLGRIEGWVVLIPFALPGELVRARVYKNRKNLSEADLVEVLEPSDDRVAPLCPLFGTCGGCQYQHLRYVAQVRWKQRQVSEVMERIGKVSTPVDTPVASPVTYGYRVKLTPHHGKFLPGKPLEIGFLRTDSRRIVDVPRCPIATEAVNAALPGSRAAVFAKAAQGKYRKGGTLLLRETENGVSTDPREIVVSRVGELRLRHLAGGFFQNNLHILPKMVEHVVAEASAGAGDFLVDTYSGVGLFAIAASSHFTSCTGVEISEPAIELARENASENGVANVTFQAASAERVFAGLTVPADATAVIVDPPRSGCDKAFLDQLRAFGPARIVYVSCDPATQARDLEVLSEEYDVRRLQPFDLFPQTRHIENVATLVRRG